MAHHPTSAFPFPPLAHRNPSGKFHASSNSIGPSRSASRASCAAKATATAPNATIRVRPGLTGHARKRHAMGTALGGTVCIIRCRVPKNMRLPRPVLLKISASSRSSEAEHRSRSCMLRGRSALAAWSPGKSSQASAAARTSPLSSRSRSDWCPVVSRAVVIHTTEP